MQNDNRSPRGERRLGDKSQSSLMDFFAPVEESLETNFFGPLAGPERQHDHNLGVKAYIPYGPMIALILLSLFLVSVFLAALIWPMASPQIRPPPANYYLGADIVGLTVTLYLAFMLLWSFLLASMTDPGGVPKRWPWDPKAPDPTPDLDTSMEEKSNLLSSRMRGLERKRDGRTRFCKKCNMYKPDRAHHCKKLGKCVLEMDHFCPWIRNTVGFRNRKYFFLSVSYGWVTLVSYCIVLGPYLPPASKLLNPLDFFIIFCWVLACIQALLLFAFWIFHIYLTVHAFTTIEFREKHLAKDTKVRRSGDKIKDLYRRSVYDLGVYNGFKHLLGPYIFLWFVPTRYGMPNEPSSGAYFEVRKDHPLVRTALENRTSASNLLKSPASDATGIVNLT